MREVAQEPEIVKLANSLITTIRKHAKQQPYTLQTSGESYVFKMSDITRNSKLEIREEKVFNKVVHFLEDLGHLKIEVSGSPKKYEFCETILLSGDSVPKIKNGEAFYVSELPMFVNQQVYRYERNKYPSHYGWKRPIRD